MNRGSGDAAAICTAPSNRFNEAPIHESGKFANPFSCVHRL